LPAACTASQWTSAPAARDGRRLRDRLRARDGRRLRDRLDPAGLVVGQHDRHQRGTRIVGEHVAEPPEIDDPVRGERDARRARGRVQDRIVLAGRDQHPRPPGPGKRQGIRLGAAAGEHDLLGARADERGVRLARVLHRAPGEAAETVYRRGIAGHPERAGDCFRSLGAHGRGRVVVKVRGARHGTPDRAKEC
jgi:hypothetical protein